MRTSAFKRNRPPLMFTRKASTRETARNDAAPEVETGDDFEIGVEKTLKEGPRLL